MPGIISDISIPDIRKFLFKQQVPDKVDTVVVLGSGLGGFVSAIENPVEIAYRKIPDFPATTVEGHDGKLISGIVKEKSVLAFAGRFHHYEGHPFSHAVLPVHIADTFNAEKMIISNAAGAVNSRFEVGDLMIIDDIFRVFQKVSAGPSEPFTYLHYKTADQVRKIAADIGLEIQRGTYLYTKGPNYETKAEIRAFQNLGVDVVGMSTVPELTEASKLGIKTTAISLVTNMAAGLAGKKLDHAEVKEAAEIRKDDFTRLVSEIIHRL